MVGIMSRKRSKENSGFPDRWQRHHGWITYRVPPGTEANWDGKRRFRLGKTPAEAYHAWAQRLENAIRVTTIGTLLDRYALEIVSKDKPRTALDKADHIPKLKKVFGTMPLAAFKPAHAYRYVYEERNGAEQGRKEIKTLSHAYTWAVQWGLIDKHPFKGQLNFKGVAGKKPTRYVEDWEILEALSLGSHRKHGSVGMIQAYIRIKLLTGLRQTDMLSLSEQKHFTDEGIVLEASKVSKEQAIKWSDELRAAVQMAIDARPLHISPLLFCKRDGASYLDDDKRASDFGHIWQRFMKRLLEETKVTEGFPERALRCKAGSDEESLERARQLLGHAIAGTTQRFYRKRRTWVEPAAGAKWFAGKKE